MANGLQQQTAGVSSGLQLSRWETHDGWMLVARQVLKKVPGARLRTAKKMKTGVT